MEEREKMEIRVDYQAKLIRVMVDSTHLVPNYLKYVFEYLKIKNANKMKIKFNDVTYKNLDHFREEYNARS